MKSLAFKTFILVFLTTFFCNTAHAQDKVTMLNCDKKEGKVTAVRDDAIKFVYKGETLEYEFKKTDLEEIIFESGRKETFKHNATTSKEMRLPADERKGK